MKMSNKRKVLTIDDRVRIIERLNLGEKNVSLAAEYGVTSTAITRIKKKRDDILKQKQVLEQCGSSTKRKKFTGIEATPREQSLFAWFSQKRDVGDHVTGPILAEQAKLFNQALQGPDGFKATSGFLTKFRKRHALKAQSIQGEKLSPDTVASAEFCQTFSQMCQDNGYSLDHIYNADETGLYWKMLPNYTIAKSDDRHVAGRKVPKDRVTVLVCTNASGTHQIPLFVIGKSQKARCFNNLLPVQYRGQTSAWMTKDLTIDWYRNVFLPAVTEKHGADQNILLLLDNAPIHPSPEQFEKISDVCKVTHLPPNVTSLIQPMNQGIIERMKKNYKTNLLRLILASDSEQGVTKLLKSITMLDVLEFINYSWRQVTPDNIRNAWKKLFPLDSPNNKQVSTNESSPGQHILSLVRSLPNCGETTEQEAKDWLNSDACDPGWKILSPNEILNGSVDNFDTYDGESEGIDEEDDESDNHDQDTDDGMADYVNDRDALQAVDVVMEYCHASWDCTASQMESLQDVREIIIQNILSNRRTV